MELGLNIPIPTTTTLDKMEEDEKEKETTNLDTEMKLNGEEEDEIVKEIDVFMSQSLSNQLHILQYPLRPPWRPYNRSYLHEVRYKPVKKKMEMDFRVSKEELENNYDTQTTDPRKTYTLASSAPVEPKTNYVLGVLRGDQLHLTPVQGTFQFRPSFAHIDKADAEKKKREKAESGEEKELKDEKVVVSLIQQMVSSWSNTRDTHRLDWKEVKRQKHGQHGSDHTNIKSKLNKRNPGSSWNSKIMQR